MHSKPKKQVSDQRATPLKQSKDALSNVYDVRFMQRFQTYLLTHHTSRQGNKCENSREASGQSSSRSYNLREANKHAGSNRTLNSLTLKPELHVISSSSISNPQKKIMNYLRQKGQQISRRTKIAEGNNLNVRAQALRDSKLNPEGEKREALEHKVKHQFEKKNKNKKTGRLTEHYISPVRRAGGREEGGKEKERGAEGFRKRIIWIRAPYEPTVLQKITSVCALLNSLCVESACARLI